MTKDEFDKIIKYSAEAIEDEWGLSGLSSGIYFDFAREVVKRYTRIMLNTFDKDFEKICADIEEKHEKGRHRNPDPPHINAKT